VTPAASLLVVRLATASLAAAAPLPIAPLTVVAKDGTHVFLELRGDGAIVDARGATVGRVEGGTVALDELSRSLWKVDVDGTVHCALFPRSGRFDAEDALVLDWDGERHRLSVGDDGTVLLEYPSGARRIAPLGASGVTARSRRAAVLLAMSALLLEREEREAPRRRPRRVTLTLDGVQAFGAYFDLASELRLDRRWSLTLRAGGGVRPLALPGSATTAAWELGVEPRWYFIGNFGTGFFVGWSTRFARTRLGPVGFESLHTPPGLSTGAMVGFKSVDVPIITPEASLGVLVPLVTPGTEVSHPPVAVAGRIGIGFSF